MSEQWVVEDLPSPGLKLFNFLDQAFAKPVVHAFLNTVQDQAGPAKPEKAKKTRVLHGLMVPCT